MSGMLQRRVRSFWSERDLRVCTTVSLVVAWSCARLGLSAEETEGLKFTVRCLMVTPNEGCAVADVDNDGKLDIAVAGKSGTYLIANEGA